MKGFIISSKDLAKSWLPKTLRADDSVKKMCPACESELLHFFFYEKGNEEDILYCPKCDKK